MCNLYYIIYFISLFDIFKEGRGVSMGILYILLEKLKKFSKIYFGEFMMM